MMTAQNCKAKISRKRQAMLGGVCAVTVGMILWAATLGAMALTPAENAAARVPAQTTAYAPTGLISPLADKQGQHGPKLVPAQPHNDW